MSRRCVCSADLQANPSHDAEFCRELSSDMTDVAKHARGLGLPTDRAARLVGAVGTEVPPSARLAATLAALDAWANTDPPRRPGVTARGAG